jgi:hypothetical protein
MTTVTISLLACLPVALAHGPMPHHDETARTPAVAGWWKGNTHTHTWWSDGDSPPESVSSWYRERGYNFLVLSDHNRMQEGEFWYPVNTDAKKTALKSYIDKFGSDWVESRERDGVTEVKLKTLDEFRSFFEARNEFIFIRGMEITDRFDKHPIHLNGVNLEKAIVPQGGTSIPEMLQKNVDAVVEQGRRSGRPMFAHVNHPNFTRRATASWRSTTVIPASATTAMRPIPTWRGCGTSCSPTASQTGRPPSCSASRPMTRTPTRPGAIGR